MENEKRTYINHYNHCNTDWDDEWDCMCNDRCPICNSEIEPYLSEDITNVLKG